jgi:hypothetical protein
LPANPFIKDHNHNDREPSRKCHKMIFHRERTQRSKILGFRLRVAPVASSPLLACAGRNAPPEFSLSAKVKAARATTQRQDPPPTTTPSSKTAAALPKSIVENR